MTKSYKHDEFESSFSLEWGFTTDLDDLDQGMLRLVSSDVDMNVNVEEQYVVISFEI